MNCFHSGNPITQDTDYVQCLLRDKDDNDTKAILHPVCFREFRNERASLKSLDPEYQIIAWKIVEPTN